MRKVLAILFVGAVSLSADCEIKFQDDNTDLRSNIVVAIKKCAVLASQKKECVTKEMQEGVSIYTLRNDLLCTQLDKNGKKRQSFVIFTGAQDGNASVSVNNDDSFKISRQISYKRIR
jgi:hypothetical protein